MVAEGKKIQNSKRKEKVRKITYITGRLIYYASESYHPPALAEKSILYPEGGFFFGGGGFFSFVLFFPSIPLFSFPRPIYFPC